MYILLLSKKYENTKEKKINSHETESVKKKMTDFFARSFISISRTRGVRSR